MTDEGEVPARVIQQFSDRSDRAAVWRALELVLETDAYLNLGYSDRFESHLVGDPQRRLVDVIGEDLARHLSTTVGTSLLDVGCGRGGPAVRLARRHGFFVTGVDLVRHNITLARKRSRESRDTCRFLVGDATRLPIRTATVPAATAIDAPVYVGAKDRFYDELARVLEPGGIAVVSDLVTTNGLTQAERNTVDTFADAWDMPPLVTESIYRETIVGASLELLRVRDVTDNSVGQFKKWARLFLRLAHGPTGWILRRQLSTRGVALDPVVEAVEAAAPALPHLRHLIVHIQRPE